MDGTLVTNRRSGGSGFVVILVLGVLAVGGYLALSGGPSVKPDKNAAQVVYADDAALTAGYQGQTWAIDPWTDSQIMAASIRIVVDDYSHGPTDHAKDQPVVRKCLDDSKTLKNIFRTPLKGRYLQACWDGQHVVFQILDHIGDVLKEKTSYIRADFTGWNDVTKYVERVQYFRVRGGLEGIQ